MNNQLVSIIVPCYNQAQYLDEALQSVLDQTYPNWECIIVNDGSPDNTEAVAKEWLAKDSRFKYIYKGNGGLSSARNTGVEIAKGEFILPLDADDKIEIEYIRLALDEFQNDSELKLVYCKAEKFGKINGLWKLKPFSLPELANYNMIFCSAIFKKTDWARIGGYDEKLIYGLEDWEFWIGLLKNGGEVKKLNLVGFFYRIKENSMILGLNNNIGIRKEQLDYLSIKHADFFVKHHGNSIQLYKENLKLKEFHLKTVSSLFYKIYKLPLSFHKNLNKFLK